MAKQKFDLDKVKKVINVNLYPQLKTDFFKMCRELDAVYDSDRPDSEKLQEFARLFVKYEFLDANQLR